MKKPSKKTQQQTDLMANITGSGTPDTVAKFTAADQIGDSNIADNGSQVEVAVPLALLDYLALSVDRGPYLVDAKTQHVDVIQLGRNNGEGSTKLGQKIQGASGEEGCFVEIAGGASTEGDGGKVTLRAGNAGGGDDHDGGDVNIFSGAKANDGTGGNISLNAGDVEGQVGLFGEVIVTGQGKAALRIESSNNDSGVVFPKLTTAQISAIVDPEESSMVYDTDEHTMKYFNGTSWVSF